MSLCNYSISAGMVQGDVNLSDIVAFVGEVGRFPHCFSSVHYQTFLGSEPTDYLLVEEVCYNF
jgi:hypothetical protein